MNAGQECFSQSYDMPCAGAHTAQQRCFPGCKRRGGRCVFGRGSLYRLSVWLYAGHAVDAALEQHLYREGACQGAHLGMQGRMQVGYCHPRITGTSAGPLKDLLRVSYISRLPDHHSRASLPLS